MRAWASVGTGFWGPVVVGAGRDRPLAPSGVEDVDDALSCRCLAVPLLGLW